ncbi:phosphonate metabolism-associated iron-containing alcohol dehydrogenase [Aminobacter lissarensis]|uniref:Phosphonate metabolism-associated iron-containing alcohol dehydrogenase n=1 Tax=Aminobacter carboxidus TaxID=376165 RepID=A0A8E2BCN0_9HYPH|nr:iron-containing alcohol dehydrogenase PsrA [Aminobacter lissarensis]MBB6467123.1 phosphonate metabolism-associated iron-containing alcohol dehydrogenase [Aminobacter lissarensis]
MWSYSNPVDIRFGRGSFSRLSDAIGGRRYALVTYGDPYFRGLVAELEAKAGSPSLIIDDIAPNPDIALLEMQTARFAKLAVQPEVVVALGGGSVIDSAKVFAAALGDFATVDAYLKKRAGAETIKPWPLIAVPTTAGTGSEVTCWGTVWDNAGGVKFSLAHPGLYPEFSIVDPDLMLGKPRELTVQTGLDALSHALESLWNRNSNPVSMAHAVMAARGVLSTLPLLANDLRNADLRERMARAATLAGFAFSNTKTAIAHSLSYPITLRHGVPHGIACSFSLPMIIRSVAGEGGICAEGLNAIFGRDAEGAADQLMAFLAKLGVATNHHHYGIEDGEWRELIGLAFDGERGQNFIGGKDNLLKAAGLGKEKRQAVA